MGGMLVDVGDGCSKRICSQVVVSEDLNRSHGLAASVED